MGLNLDSPTKWLVCPLVLQHDNSIQFTIFLAVKQSTNHSKWVLLLCHVCTIWPLDNRDVDMATGLDPSWHRVKMNDSPTEASWFFGMKRHGHQLPKIPILWAQSWETIHFETQWKSNMVFLTGDIQFYHAKCEKTQHQCTQIRYMVLKERSTARIWMVKWLDSVDPTIYIPPRDDTRFHVGSTWVVTVQICSKVISTVNSQ